MYISEHIRKQLQKLLGKENVLTDEAALLLNGYDCSQSRHRPDLVLNLSSVSQLAPVIALLWQAKTPFIPRASATNHAGSCSAIKGGAVLNLNALNRISSIYTSKGFAEVEPCVITGDLQQELESLGFFYAPDPASEKISTLSGNLAQNASGARCMKYGNTADHTLAVHFITPDGKTHYLRHDQPGPDWLGLIAGSEGTLGLIEKMTVKILPLPKHVHTFLTTFPSLEQAIQTVTDLVAQGIIPRCIEAMDRTTTQAVENFSHAGYPTQAEALLILELDGELKTIQQQAPVLEKICQQNKCQTFITAKTEKEREKLWQGRRAAYSAMAALAPDVAVGDGTVPRSALPQALKKVREIIEKYGVFASLLFHAGDGNFHPQLVFDSRQPEQTQRVGKALQEILKTCVDFGGTISGEHGVGVQKRALMAYQYDAPTLRLFQQIKKAFDPANLANPEKIIPVGFEEKARPFQEENKEVLALAQEIKNRFSQKIPSLICGYNPSPKEAFSHALPTDRLRQILEIDKANFTATVQAGIQVNHLAQALEKENTFAKLPPQYTGSLGGLIAAKTYLPFINQLTSIQVILPNGDIVNYGGKLMKNAAGYNLCRLFAGSMGQLGLITKVTFKIYAFPQQAETLSAPFSVPTDDLFIRMKKVIDPEYLFISAQEGGKQ
ncbi:MAG: FAD-binding protein [Elusimicrobiaceae bacterium]|nr:FAD-binding protein [Elusimicrobiaceae bacterium]